MFEVPKKQQFSAILFDFETFSSIGIMNINDKESNGVGERSHVLIKIRLQKIYPPGEGLFLFSVYVFLCFYINKYSNYILILCGLFVTL